MEFIMEEKLKTAGYNPFLLSEIHINYNLYYLHLFLHPEKIYDHSGDQC